MTYTAICLPLHTRFLFLTSRRTLHGWSRGEGLSTRKTYVINLEGDLSSYDGQHVTAAFDNSKSAWASEANPLGKSPTCSSVEVLSVG